MSSSTASIFLLLFLEYNRTAPTRYNMKNPDGMSFTKTLGSICKKSECRCDAVTKNAVGIYNKPMGQWPVFWHNQTIMWEMIETLSSTLDGYWYVRLPAQKR